MTDKRELAAECEKFKEELKKYRNRFMEGGALFRDLRGTLDGYGGDSTEAVEEIKSYLDSWAEKSDRYFEMAGKAEEFVNDVVSSLGDSESGSESQEMERLKAQHGMKSFLEQFEREESELNDLHMKLIGALIAFR